jgi:hypothetical protein
MQSWSKYPTKYATQFTREQLRKYRDSFRWQKSSASGRKDKAGNPIEFRLTFDEWLDIWLASGQIDNRGKQLGQYVMSRVGDMGHYEASNVVIKLHSENIKEANCGLKHTSERRRKISAAQKRLH